MSTVAQAVPNASAMNAKVCTTGCLSVETGQPELAGDGGVERTDQPRRVDQRQREADDCADEEGELESAGHGWLPLLFTYGRAGCNA